MYHHQTLIPLKDFVMRFLLLTFFALGLFDLSSFAFVVTPRGPKSTLFESTLHAAVTGIDSSCSQTKVFEQQDLEVEFPPPLTKSERLSRAATFWLRGLPIVANYLGLMNSLRFHKMIGHPLEKEDVQVRKSKL